jgi:hypothetical protein
VSDPKRRIEYLGDGVVNLPPGASCVWITDGYEQEEDEDGHDLRDKPWRSEGHPKKMIFVAFGHWQIIMGDQERCFDLDEKDPDFFWDFPEELRWYSEPRELPEDGHFHWFDCSGHDGYRIHCEGWQDPQRTAGATVATEAAEGQDFNSLELKHA